MFNTKDPRHDVWVTEHPSPGHVSVTRIILPAKDVKPESIESFDAFKLAKTIEDQIDDDKSLCGNTMLEMFLMLRLKTTRVGARNFICFTRDVRGLPHCEGCYGPVVGFISVCPICGQKGLDLL